MLLEEIDEPGAESLTRYAIGTIPAATTEKLSMFFAPTALPGVKDCTVSVGVSASDTTGIHIISAATAGIPMRKNIFIMLLG
jgi:hypothetical protein